MNFCELNQLGCSFFPLLPFESSSCCISDHHASIFQALSPYLTWQTACAYMSGCADSWVFSNSSDELHHLRDPRIQRPCNCVCKGLYHYVHLPKAMLNYTTMFTHAYLIKLKKKFRPQVFRHSHDYRNFHFAQKAPEKSEEDSLFATTPDIVEDSVEQVV